MACVVWQTGSVVHGQKGDEDYYMGTVGKSMKLSAVPAVRKLADIPYAFRYGWKRVLVVLLLAAAVAAVCGLGLCETRWDEAGGLYKGIYDMVDTIMGQTSLDEVLSIISVECTDSTLTVAGNSFGNVGMITALNEFCVLVAFVLASVMFFISLVNDSAQNFTEELLVKKLVFLGVTFVLCYFAKDICYYITNIGTGIAGQAAQSAQAGVTQEDMDAVKEAIFNDCYTQTDGLGLFEGFFTSIGNAVSPLGYFLALVLPWVVMWAVTVLTRVVCWSRAFEIVVLATFSPLAFYEVQENGRFGQGAGARFVKNICALALSGAVILFVMALANSFSVEYISQVAEGSVTLMSAVGNLVVIGVSQVGLVMKAQSLARTVCGAG